MKILKSYLLCYWQSYWCAVALLPAQRQRKKKCLSLLLRVFQTASLILRVPTIDF